MSSTKITTSLPWTIVALLLSVFSYYVAEDQGWTLAASKSSVFIDGTSATNPADAIIIGGGHAGLSGALTLYRHQLSMLIFDDDRPRNSWFSPTRALSGWEGQDPRTYRRKSRREILSSGFARLIDRRATNITSQTTGQDLDNTLFSVIDATGQTWYGRKLLLTPGAEFEMPDIEGYEDNFPDRIFHCMFTFGFERRGSKSAGLLARDALGSVRHAKMVWQDASKFAEDVTLYTNGNSNLTAQLREERSITANIDDRQILRLRKEVAGQGVFIDFADGESVRQDFIVHQPKTRPNRALVEQLGLELDMFGNIATTGFFYNTNVPGVHAGGDVASPFKMIPNALLSGSNAAAGIARELPRSVTGNPVMR